MAWFYLLVLEPEDQVDDVCGDEMRSGKSFLVL